MWQQAIFMIAYLHRWSIIISYTFKLYAYLIYFLLGLWDVPNFIPLVLHPLQQQPVPERQIHPAGEVETWCPGIPTRQSQFLAQKMSEVTHKMPREGIVWGQVMGYVSHISLSCTTTGLRDADSLNGRHGLWLLKKGTRSSLQPNGEKNPAKITALNQTSLVLSSEQFPVTPKDAMFLGGWLWITAQDQCCTISK